MSANALSLDPPIRKRNFEYRRAGMQRIVLSLLTLGMIASLVALVSSELAVRSQMKPDELIAGNIVKSQIYYIAHAIGITLSVSAGLLALFGATLPYLQRGYLLRFVLLLAAVFLMTIRGYTVSDLLSTRIVDDTGPFPFLLSLLVFVGARRSNWDFLSKLALISAAVLSSLALFGMSSLHSFSRSEAVATIGGTLNALYWPASWVALKDYSQPSVWRGMRFIPILIYTLGSLLVQTRLNFIMIFALIGMYAYLQRRRRQPQTIEWIFALIITLWLGLFATIFLTRTAAFARIEDVANAFSSRLDEDTRTGQLVSFAEDVQPHELLFGRGSFATWNWAGIEYKGGTDVGYLTLLLFGGAPLLITYLAAHVGPGLNILRTTSKGFQLTAAATIFLWSIRMFSSDYPNYDPGYYFVLFSVGACISRDTSCPRLTRSVN